MIDVGADLRVYPAIREIVNRSFEKFVYRGRTHRCARTEKFFVFVLDFWEW